MPFFIPIIAAVAASGASTGGGILASMSRINGQQKLTASAFADEAERYMQENLNAWNAIPANQKTRALRDQAVQVFYYWWNQLEEKCATLGAAGQRCISERARGATNSWGNLDWFELYLDPIQNSTIVDNVVGGGSANVTNGSTATGSGTNTNGTVPGTTTPTTQVDLSGDNMLPLVLMGLAVAYVTLGD